MFRFRAEGDIKKLVLGTPDRRSSARRQKNVRDHNRIIGDVRHQVADTKIQEMRSVSPVPLGGGSRWSAGSRPLEAAFFIDQVTRSRRGVSVFTLRSNANHILIYGT